MWRRLCMLILASMGAVTALAEVAPAPAAPSSPAPVPAYRQASTVAVLTVHGGIDDVTLKSLERRLERAKAAGAQAIVIDLDTPGGEMTATLNICHLVKNSMPPNSVAWINPRAYSAGTIIALACREIVVTPSASFGDAAPIQAPLGMLIALPDAERAKLESVLKDEVEDSARRNHYDEKLVQSFVAVKLELWMLESVSTGEAIFVDADEYRTVMGEEPPHQRASATTMPAASRVRPQVETRFDPTAAPTSPPPSPEEALYLQTRPSARPVLTEADRGQWRFVMQVDAADELLTVRSGEALYYGLARATIANDQELAAYFGATALIRLDESWSEKLVRTLMWWPVQGILIVIFLVGFFVEIATPGVGWFGLAALGAVLVLVGAPALMGLAQWWTLVAILLGLALVLVELFVIPGFGITGILGALCVLAGLVGVFVSGDISTPEGQRELWTGIGTTFVSVFAAGIGVWMIVRQFESIPLFRRFILTAELKSGGESGVGLLEAMASADRVLQVGEQGIAATDLRPVGKASFEGRLVEVQSISGYIDRGVPIVVTGISPSVVEVEEVRP
jgi:membrane-bound serine protease (ClpP class)